MLELAHDCDDVGVGRRLASLSLEDAHLDELYGAGARARLGDHYRRAFAVFCGAGALEIAGKIRERRYDDVEVRPGSGVCPEAASGDGPAGSEALRTNEPVYTVRLKRADESDGIRIDTFVFLDGAWRTALKIGLRAA